MSTSPSTSWPQEVFIHVNKPLDEVWFFLYQSQYGKLGPEENPKFMLLFKRRFFEELIGNVDSYWTLLHSVHQSLATLCKNDITELAAIRAPPVGLDVVIIAVAILMGWDTSSYSKAALALKKNFPDLLKIDLETIPSKRLQTVEKKYLGLPHFNPETVARVSKAGKSLCMWTIAAVNAAKIKKRFTVCKKHLGEEYFSKKFNAETAQKK